MARIRTIKPEICASPQFVECSSNARLLFVLSWCFFDDGGVHHDDPLRFKMEVFPGDPHTLNDMRHFMDELVTSGLWSKFEYNNKKYIYVTGWKHQKIDRPSYKFPGPLNPETRVDITEFVQRTLDEDSTNARRTLDDQSPPEGKGREGKGKEGNREGAKRATSPPKDFPVTAGMRDWASTRAKGANLELETEKFLNYAGARGKKYRDWEKAWRNWILKSLEFNPPRSNVTEFPNIPGMI